MHDLVAPKSVPGTGMGPNTWHLTACETRSGVLMSIRERQPLHHRLLERDVLTVEVPHTLIDRAARRMLSLLIRIHFLLERGANIHFRKVGTFRSRWSVEMLSPGLPNRLVWNVEQRTVEALDDIDLQLERNCGAFREPDDHFSALKRHLSYVERDLTRDQLVEQTIRENLDMEMRPLLAVLQSRGLLD